MDRGYWTLGEGGLMERELPILVEITASLSMVAAFRRPTSCDEWRKESLELLRRVGSLARVLLRFPLLTRSSDSTAPQSHRSSLLLLSKTLLILNPRRPRSLATCSSVPDAPT